jgi:hypothetical protein
MSQIAAVSRNVTLPPKLASPTAVPNPWGETLWCDPSSGIDIPRFYISSKWY